MSMMVRVYVNSPTFIVAEIERKREATTIITLAEWYREYSAQQMKERAQETDRLPTDVLAPAGQNSFFKTGIVPLVLIRFT
jgi:hypothetical protein